MAISIEELPFFRRLQKAIEKANPFGDGPSLVQVSLYDLEKLMEMMTGEEREWAKAIQRERVSANIYRHLWLIAERELQELRIALYEETGAIELDLGNEVGEELEALAYHRGA